MRHDWIFDVLMDLRSYAQANGLPALAAKAEEALRIARVEIPAIEGTGIEPKDEPGAGNAGGLPPGGRAH